MTTISAHILVKNEARFIWYSIMSVINYVDQLIIWDAGSTDNTRQIISEIIKNPEYKKKIVYLETDENPFDEQLVRQKMLDMTKTDWFVVVDGDEIWWDASINDVTNFIRKEGHRYESIVVPMIMPIGDIFHYQEERAGHYTFGDKKGHYALRAVNTKIPGLSSLKPHGQWGWVDEKGNMIQDRDKRLIKFLNAPYMHVTHLLRAGNYSQNSDVFKRKMKLKHELGNKFSLDYYFPEVFFRERPLFATSVWQTMSLTFFIKALILTPLRKIKRRLKIEKVGY